MAERGSFLVRQVTAGKGQQARRTQPKQIRSRRQRRRWEAHTSQVPRCWVKSLVSLDLIHEKPGACGASHFTTIDQAKAIHDSDAIPSPSAIPRTGGSVATSASARPQVSAGGAAAAVVLRLGSRSHVVPMTVLARQAYSTSRKRCRGRRDRGRCNRSVAPLGADRRGPGGLRSGRSSVGSAPSPHHRQDGNSTISAPVITDEEQHGAAEKAKLGPPATSSMLMR
ncbi:hypothetical protein ACU4GH_38645 [Bradyrhizobium betae]